MINRPAPYYLYLSETMLDHLPPRRQVSYIKHDKF
jgi:hypothetical protein